ncbi:MAG: sensor domain-containing diguanylate cyclase [Candidatus Thiodiazotropha sp.]
MLAKKAILLSKPDDTGDSLQLKLHNTEKALRSAQQRLEDELKRWRLLIENSRDGIVVIDETGGVYEANKQFAAMLGYTKDEVLNLHVWDWDAVFSKEEIQGMIRDIDDAGDHFETRHRRKDDQIINVELSTNGANYQGKKLIFCICRDITEQKRLQQALKESEERYRRLSIIDELTSLYNSRYFYDQLKKEIKRAERSKQPLSLIMCDIDDFKRYNDEYGHIAGDMVLTTIGQEMKRCLRQTDSPHRYGGDELTAILPGTDLKGGRVLAEKLRLACKQLQLPLNPDNPVHITISIGVTEHCKGDTLSGLVQRADHALYKAKQQGKDRVCHEKCKR